MIPKGPGEKTPSLGAGHALLVVDPYPLHAAARGIALEDEATNIFLLQLPDPFFRPVKHLLRHIELGPDRHEPGLRRVALQMHCLPGNAKAAFHLGTGRDVLDIRPKGVDKKAIELVPPVIADLLPEKTGTDPQPYPRFRAHHVITKVYGLIVSKAREAFTAHHYSCGYEKGLLASERVAGSGDPG